MIATKRLHELLQENSALAETMRLYPEFGRLVCDAVHDADQLQQLREQFHRDALALIQNAGILLTPSDALDGKVQ